MPLSSNHHALKKQGSLLTGPGGYLARLAPPSEIKVDGEWGEQTWVSAFVGVGVRVVGSFFIRKFKTFASKQELAYRKGELGSFKQSVI